MMKSKIPTILAILILLISLIALLFAKNQIKQFKSSAETPNTPQNLNITNIKNNSFTVSWLTDSPTIGFVRYKNSSGQTFQSPPTISSTTHFVTLQNLDSATPYTFEINSGGQYFQNRGSGWKVVTLTSFQLPDNPSVISGRIMTKAGFPAKNAIIYVSGIGFETQSTVVSDSGNWVISLPPLADTTLLKITVDYSTNLQTTARIELKSASPIPTMVLGNSYNFTGDENKSTLQDDKPETSITLP